ncbi:pectinesterase family protein [Massilia sp. Root351]|uniref:pectinesterase family protein n=1 Tax=Massilia sp. Root351 TaxID=1736522 RepID=UPI0009EA689C|nr:pectinesterase family protein [Massilia sp. Root351]
MMRRAMLAATLAATLAGAPAAQAQAPAADSSTAARATASTGTARPQLSAARAAHYSYSEVLKYAGPAGSERADPWDPLADPLAKGASFVPTYVVDAAAKPDGVKTFNTVQAAVSRAAASGQRERVYILVRPGVYQELVYVPASATPLTLYGEGSSAAATKITARLDAATTGASYTAQFGAQFAAADPAVQAMHALVKERAAAGNGNIGTFGSMTMWVKSDGFQARNLTIENGYNKDTGNAREECGERPCGKTDINPQQNVVHHQAVALQVEGADKVQFENIRLIGFQDTLFLRAADTRVTVRSFFNKSYIEGDVDFIFGDSTAFFLQSEIKSLGDRSTSYVGAPNTNHKTRYGLVFDQCRFTHDGSPFALAGKFYLARQWFHNSRCTPYGKVPLPGYACVLGAASQFRSPAGTITPTVLETVGKMAVLNSRIGAHINRTTPWSDWNRNGTLSYRPAQFNSDDYWTNLRAAGIDPVKELGYTRQPVPADSYLAEYNNIYE